MELQSFGTVDREKFVLYSSHIDFSDFCIGKEVAVFGFISHKHW